MDHLIAKIRASKGAETDKLKKVLSEVGIYQLGNTLEGMLASFVPYEPEHNLEEGTWFGLERFSKAEFCLSWLKDTFDSVAYAQLLPGESKQIDYLCSYQGENLFCFQKVSKSQFLSRRFFLSIGDHFSLQEGKTLLAIHDDPDAVYVRDRDILLFQSLSTIASIFKGIDQLYRVATMMETTEFLQRPFIRLADDFEAAKVSKPNLHRIALAAATLEELGEPTKVTAYIQDYCNALPYQDNAFTIATDNDLKYLLYGIEQRYYTTPFTNEKRIASGILKL